MKKTNPAVFSLALCLAAAPLLVTLTGCMGDRYHQSTGEAIDDQGITMRVKSALSNDGTYKYDGVNVQSFKGTVQLSGFVDSSAQKSRAADLARGVEGVRNLENNITVK